jgi:hypothetical protein
LGAARFIPATPTASSFFDTPDLALNKAGVVVRARRVQGRSDDTVVKLRPIVPGELPNSAGLQQLAGLLARKLVSRRGRRNQDARLPRFTPSG